MTSRKTMAGSSRKSKRPKRSHVVKEVATLSDFPDEILHYILSFLDTKSAVGTSILSRRWRCLWKDVLVLNFLPKSFCKLASFRKHVYRLLSLRSHRTPVRKVIFDVRGYKRDETPGHITRTIEQIMRYAASHGGGGLDHLSIIGEDQNLCFSYFDENITAGNHRAPLKSMKLEGCTLWCIQCDDVGFKSCTTLGFKLLTTLELRECPLSPYCPILPFDLIGDLPCLKYLKLIRCFIADPDCWLLISGPQLLDLEVEFTNHYRFYELIAPKLKSLRLWGEYIDEYLPKLDLPSLDHANIRLKWEPERWEDDDPVFIEQNSAFVNYLCGLHNVESLKLCFDKEQRWKNDWEEQPFPLNRIKALVEHEASPFNRLKTLTIQCAHQRHPPNIPYQVIRYFLEGSSNTEEKFVKFELLAD
ncbi:unnamed protein product [Linum tenue]|uniref:F-box domain-containing protein n=1 Tax=Linum tenue TaxID=586396 RepID=A0AAV0GSI4_9ROSI|nr:unnamed protein product [Linum tenue]